MRKSAAGILAATCYRRDNARRSIPFPREQIAMSSDPSFDDVTARLRAGDQDAARAIFQRFAGRLIRLAHERLDSLVRTKVDPEDVVQSVFKSFFLRYAEGRFDLGDWDSLWGLLVVITLRKCGREVKRFHGPHHDVRRELPAAGGEAGGGWDVLAREPTPAEAVMLADTVEQFLRDLGPRERRVLELRLQGCTVPEISAEVDRTEYTVEGMLRKIRKRLGRLQDDTRRP
jgi:RNA polymerase sigma-70 factor (ECF subfamily)